MKKLMAALTLLTMSVAFLVACGGSDQVTKENLAAAMDQVCSDATADFDALGPRGMTNGGIALEVEGTSAVRRQIVDELNEIDADDEAQPLLDEYVAASEEIIANDQKVIAAAKKDDTDAVNAAFGETQAAFDSRDGVAEKIGTEVCGKTVEIAVEPTGTEPPADLDYAKPSNTVDQAAKAFLEAARSGDCDAMNETHHTDATELTQELCGQVTTMVAGAKVAGTEQYGPVGQAEVVTKDGTHLPTYFVADLDGELRYGGDTIHDQGGLRPAPEGNDAEQQAKATVTAIRDDDPEAFNAVLESEDSPFHVEGDSFDEFGSGKFVKSLVGDIRDGDDEPVQLGLNSTWGFYFLPGSEHDWVLAMIHRPGAGGNYVFGGYYPVPKAG